MIMSTMSPFKKKTVGFFVSNIFFASGYIFLALKNNKLITTTVHSIKPTELTKNMQITFPSLLSSNAVRISTFFSTGISIPTFPHQTHH